VQQQPQPDLVVSGAWLVTMDAEQKVLADGALAIAGDSICAVGTAAELQDRFPSTTTLHEPHGLIMPGLINAHTHAAMACFRGLADDLPLMQWLTEYIFPAEASLTGELVYQSTQLSICEMIRSGTTSFCDMYLFAADVARAAAESGMRAWIGEVLYDFPSPCYGELEQGFACVRALQEHYRAHPLIEITVDPHAVYTCAPDLLCRLAELAQATDSRYHIHLAETADEVATCKERYGCAPVQHLDRLGLLNERCLAAHCVMLEPDEIMLLAQRGVKVVHCPESNMKLASGVAPVVEMLDAGVQVGLGTDGSASNNDVDLFGEMNMAAKLHKVTRLDPLALDAPNTLGLATRGGAQVLGAGDRIGSLEPGKRADLIVLDLHQPHLTPLYNPISHLVYAARGSDVLHSMINGRLVMRDRRLLTLDEAAILDRVQKLSTAVARSRESS
jgi:5-methylthioadenosine/S-adenosylhomocysteine deaminase